MDDEAVERILNSIEKAYGKDVMTLGANQPNFRRAVIRGFLYGSDKEREAKVEKAVELHKSLTGKYRVTFTDKQYEPLSDGWLDKYESE